ncbi:DNA-dependent RNA polymerase II [Marasmius sp. AFHP31]|nr:DNA-dependent RNA polymerase II [Marasmius sp. AFHP31]
MLLQSDPSTSATVNPSTPFHVPTFEAPYPVLACSFKPIRDAFEQKLDKADKILCNIPSLLHSEREFLHIHIQCLSWNADNTRINQVHGHLKYRDTTSAFYHRGNSSGLEEFGRVPSLCSGTEKLCREYGTCTLKSTNWILNKQTTGLWSRQGPRPHASYLRRLVLCTVIEFAEEWDLESPEENAHSSMPWTKVFANGVSMGAAYSREGGVVVYGRRTGL